MTGPTTTQARIVGRQVVSLLALAVIAFTLLGNARTGLDVVRSRTSSSQPAAQIVELNRLDCIDRAVRSVTSPGQAVRVRTDAEPYLEQRVMELIAPRLEVTEDVGAPVLLVVTQPVPTGAPRCQSVEVTLSAGG